MLEQVVRVFPEAVAQMCSVKKVFLEISQNSLENTCARVSFLIKLRASGLKNTFLYRTPPVAATVFRLRPFSVVFVPDVSHFFVWIISIFYMIQKALF